MLLFPEAVIGFNPNVYSGPEGTVVRLGIEVLSGALGCNVTIALSTQDDTATGRQARQSVRCSLVYNNCISDLCYATDGVDYVNAVDQQLTFSSSVSSQTVSISVTDDYLVEIDEVFMALLTNPGLPHLTINPTTATVTISNNDSKKYYVANVRVIIFTNKV